jgi:hypothetical protein
VLLDAEYGSATFIPVTGSAELELRVSTTGLLIREAKPYPDVVLLPTEKTIGIKISGDSQAFGDLTPLRGSP